MKIYLWKYKVLIVSNRLSNILSNLIGFDGKKGRSLAMGFAVFPCFMIFRNLTHPMTEQWINHESIHVRQYLESLGLIYVYSKLEYIYARIFLKYSRLEAYKYECMEQEAYLNQHGMNYLKNRKLFSIMKYAKRKINFDIDKSHHVVIKSSVSISG